jgi:hypothetical protein
LERTSIHKALNNRVERYRGVNIIVGTACIYIVPLDLAELEG